MKICYIGSRHTSVFKSAISEYTSPQEEFFFLDDGVESFYESIQGDKIFLKKIEDVDIFFLDCFADFEQKPERYNYISHTYQKLIWYIYSICPRSDINEVRFLSFPQNIGAFSRFFPQFRPKNCRVLEPSDEFKVYSSKDDEIIDVCTEIMQPRSFSLPDSSKLISATPEGGPLVNSEEDVSDNKLSLIAAKLEKKKDFNTTSSFPPVLKKNDKDPMITFGIVNCNRLFYLKSCLESLIISTENYPNKQFIIVDNCSSEKGTREYLEEKENEGVKVFRTEKRDPKNEFAKALNTICENSKDSDFVCPLQGDMQFITKGWLTDYLSFFKENLENIGCLCLDAQRGWRNRRDNHSYPNPWFTYTNRAPVCGAADVIYSRKIIDLIYPWSVDNEAHESNRSKGKAKDSETKMLNKARKVIKANNLSLKFCQPIIPVSCAITTDLNSGGNARISGEELIGDYWPPKEDNYRYYEISNYSDLKIRYKDSKIPIGKEVMAIPVGWKAPLNKDGHWLKKPITVKR